MKLFRKVVMNGFQLEDYPFEREFELEGCLACNPELLSLNDDEYQVDKLIDIESFVKRGRKDKDGRLDMVVSYSGGQIGIVELKRGAIDTKALEQLTEYLKSSDNLKKNRALIKYAEDEEINVEDKQRYVGVLVGTGIHQEVQVSIEQRKDYPLIYVIILNRLRSENEGVFIFSEVRSARGRDYTQYTIGDDDRKFGKGRLVLEVIRRYIATNRDITYEKLKDVFPDKLRGVVRKGMGCFIWKAEAKDLVVRTGYRRYYLKDEEILHIKDGEIAVSTEWGVGNIEPFIKHVKDSLKFDIKVVKQS